MWLLPQLSVWVATGGGTGPTQAETVRSGVLLFIIVILILLILVVIAALLFGRAIARNRTEVDSNEDTDLLPDPWIEAARRVRPFGRDTGTD